MPAEKLDSHVDEECGFRMVACNYCREETTANQLEVSCIDLQIWAHRDYNTGDILLTPIHSPHTPGTSEPVSQGPSRMREMFQVGG